MPRGTRTPTVPELRPIVGHMPQDARTPFVASYLNHLLTTFPADGRIAMSLDTLSVVVEALDGAVDAPITVGR